MRLSFVGALLGASLVIGAMAGRSSSEPAYGPPIDLPARTRQQRIVHPRHGDRWRQPLTVTVIDPRQRVMAVYHVDRVSGEITPKSVRNITWDLQMIEFNSGKPLAARYPQRPGALARGRRNPRRRFAFAGPRRMRMGQCEDFDGTKAHQPGRSS